mgnify:CR=1 FL=1
MKKIFILTAFFYVLFYPVTSECYKKDSMENKGDKNASQVNQSQVKQTIEIETLKHPCVFLPTNVYQFNKVVEGTVLNHEFIVHNKGEAPLEIKKVKPG